MWAHYAANHTGICVGLNMDRIIGSCGVAVHGDVHYQDQPFSLKVGVDEDFFSTAIMNRLAQALFTKDLRWSYEQEVRVVVYKQPAAQTAEGAVQSVVLGLRATHETRLR